MPLYYGEVSNSIDNRKKIFPTFSLTLCKQNVPIDVARKYPGKYNALFLRGNIRNPSRSKRLKRVSWDFKAISMWRKAPMM